MSVGRQLSLLAGWTRVRLLIWVRTPRAAFFTFVFPLLLLVLLNSVNSGTDLTSTTTGEKVSFATYFTPSIGVFALITGCYQTTIGAHHHRSGRGELKISTSTNGGWHELRISDDGPGITPEARAHLFEPFFTTRSRGTGLGLVTARRIVEAHGGTVELHSPGDRGTVAVVRLPAA